MPGGSCTAWKLQHDLACRGTGPGVGGDRGPARTVAPVPERPSGECCPVAEVDIGRAGIGDHEVDVAARPADRLAGIEDDEVIRGRQRPRRGLPLAARSWRGVVVLGRSTSEVAPPRNPECSWMKLASSPGLQPDQACSAMVRTCVTSQRCGAPSALSATRSRNDSRRSPPPGRGTVAPSSSAAARRAAMALATSRRVSLAADGCQRGRGYGERLPGVDARLVQPGLGGWTDTLQVTETRERVAHLDAPPDRTTVLIRPGPPPG